MSHLAAPSRPTSTRYPPEPGLTDPLVAVRPAWIFVRSVRAVRCPTGGAAAPTASGDLATMPDVNPLREIPIVAAVIRRNGRLLLVEEQGPDDATAAWMLPGGRVEPGETLIDALRREVAEETGPSLVGTPKLAFTVQVRTRRGDEVLEWRAASFACVARGRLQPNDPDRFVKRAAWVPMSEALDRLSCVAWYDCEPLRRFLAGAAALGAEYVLDGGARMVTLHAESAANETSGGSLDAAG